MFQNADPVTLAWMRRRVGPAQLSIFLCVQLSTTLLNYSDERGFWVEPGSTDAEAVSWEHETAVNGAAPSSAPPRRGLGAADEYLTATVVRRMHDTEW
jgi:hypothetical protein